MPQPTKYWQRVQGKVAIVTGAGSQGAGFGTGKAISYLLAKEGAKVCLVDQDPARVRETHELIAEAGGTSLICTGDVTETRACESFIAAAVEHFGGVDILVNNVGIAPRAEPVETFDEAIWDRVMNVNLKSAALMAKYAIPAMLKAGSGSIVNISSTASLISSGLPSYAASKAAVNALTCELAVLYGRRRIRVNTVAPGAIFTPMLATVLSNEALTEMRERRRKVAPLGIEGDAWDVASAVLFLASDDARFITGVCIPVDGGVTKIAPLTAYELIKNDAI
jgi:NAD(P)-dependent dehydrogenase (short-subunit alcohol dehydrogenase family)